MAVRTRTFFICATLAILTACGGDDDGQVAIVDAPLPVDAPTDAAIDAFVCNPPNMTCAGQCVDLTSNDDFCGDCDTACRGSQSCSTSACECVAISIDAMPGFFMPMIIEPVSGLTVGAGGVSSGTTIDAILIGLASSGTTENTPYELSGASVGSPPFAAYGYDLDISNFNPAAAYYATAGTLTFTKICPGSSGIIGFSGTITDAVFQEVEGDFNNPTLLENGCSIGTPQVPIPSVTFSFGDVSCTNQ